MAKSTETATKAGKTAEGTKVKSKDVVSVIGTGKGYMKKGKSYEVHKIASETLIERGFAELDKKSKESESK